MHIFSTFISLTKEAALPSQHLASALQFDTYHKKNKH